MMEPRLYFRDVWQHRCVAEPDQPHRQHRKRARYTREKLPSGCVLYRLKSVGPDGIKSR